MKKYFYFLFAIVCIVAIATSCKKSSYLTDDGLHNAKTSLTTYEYLRQHPWKLFDTLIMIVDKFKMAEELNQAGTFFAPTNYSINNYMTLRKNQLRLYDPNAQYNMDSLYKDITKDSVRQYLFKEQITLKDAQEDAVPYKSLANTSMAVVKNIQTGNGNFTQWTSGDTYLLSLIKVRGALDQPNVIPPQNEIDIKVLCQTTGIETSSGGILHVLSNSHTFVRF